MIELIDICKQYNYENQVVVVLDRVNLKIEKGECVCLRGPSGTGKTTLLNIIGGMLAPTSGTAIFNGSILTRMPQHFLSAYRREHVGFIFQHYNLLENFTVMENLLMPIFPSGKPLKPYMESFQQVMERLQIKHRKDFRVNRLSGGEQQRVGVARALANDPDIILADEPFSNLDAENRAFIIELFHELKNAGKTFVLTATSEASELEKEFLDRDIHYGYQ